MPVEGEVYDFSETGTNTSSDLMIWTPEHSSTGFFADEPVDDFVQIYHIYVFSPEEREARFWFRNDDRIRAWNNGTLVFSRDNWDGGVEQSQDFALKKGINSLTFSLSEFDSDNYLAVRITDRSDVEYTDLAYSFGPLLPLTDAYVSRTLPRSYDAGGTITVTLSLRLNPNDKPSAVTVIESVPQGLSVGDAGEGTIIGNTIQWSLGGEGVRPRDLGYALTVPVSQRGNIPFIGHIVYGGNLIEEVVGDDVAYEEAPPSPWEMAGSIETIEIDPGSYSAAENVTMGGGAASDYSGSLEDFGRGLVSGLKPSQTGGWAEYELSVTHAGEYQIILDYGELWTMFHQAADVTVTVDGSLSLQTFLFPTTHCYSYPYGSLPVYDGAAYDPERKAKWTVGSVSLSSGSHTLRLTFPAMYPAETVSDRFNDGRPVITKIVVTNYPGLVLPCAANPHHLD